MVDEVISILRGRRNKPGWFTTKEYVDGLTIEPIIQEVVKVRFTIANGELITEDITSEILTERFSLGDDGMLMFSADYIL